MSGNLRVDVSGLNLQVAEILSGDVIEALTHEGAPIVLAKSQELVPKRSGDLASSASIKANRGGNNTVAIVYDSVYAAWVHEHLWFHHPFGGTSKFLEKAMRMEGEAALNKAAKSLF